MANCAVAWPRDNPSMPKRVELLVTCEHGGKGVPPLFVDLFAGAGSLLDSHRGWDAGALELARRFALHFEAPLLASTVTRLLVDLNRSEDNPTLFSSLTTELDDSARFALLGRYYHPYRQRVIREVQQFLKQGATVLHLSVHTFTPSFDGEIRDLDIGLLYDPSRQDESRIVSQWSTELGRCLGVGWKVRHNQPYHGKMDGVAESMRSLFPEPDYIGIELEVNQKFPLNELVEWENIQQDLVISFDRAVHRVRNES